MTDQATHAPVTAPDQRLEHFPIALFASVMGLSGLALALHVGGAYFSWGSILPRLGLILAAAALLVVSLIYAVKAVRFPQAIAVEWRHPVKLNFFPAIPISFLLVATALRFEWAGAASLLWSMGAIGQAGLTLAVISVWMGPRGFGLGQVTPAWFIPAVGNVVVPVAGVPLGFVDISWLFFAAGLMFWVALLPILLQRLITETAMPAKLQPTLAILIAPPAVGLLSWLQLNGGVLDGFALLLFNAALAFGALVAVQLARSLRGAFALSWWALSFPLAALTISCFRVAEIAGSTWHGVLGVVLLILLTGVVGGLVVRTLLGAARGEICRPE